MKRSRGMRLVALGCLAALLAGCDLYTSIKRDEDGRYVIVAQQSAKILIGDYDPATKKMTIRERR